MRLALAASWLLCILIVATCAAPIHAQVVNETSTTDSVDLTGTTTPTRITATQIRQDGRTTETRILERPSINGGYASLLETEQQTVQSSPNSTTVVKREYSRDSNGNRRLLAVTEEQRSTAPGGRESVVRTQSIADLNGTLQLIQREVQETVPTGEDTRQTTATVSRQTANGFEAIQRSQQIEQRKGDVTERHMTMLTPDGNGNFVPVSRTESTITTTATGQTKDERLFSDIGLGGMIVSQREVTTESADGQGTQSTTQTYSAFVPGSSPDPGSLVLVQQISASQRIAPDGSSQSRQQIQAINLGNPTAGLQLATSITEVSQPTSTGQATLQIVRSSDSNGGFPVVWVTNTRETKFGNPARGFGEQ